jgi:hypothetical protein
VVQAGWLRSFPVGAIGAGVFCFFFAEVQQNFVVGEQGGLGIFDLIMSGSCSCVGVVEFTKNCVMIESKAEMVDWKRSDVYKA